MGGGGGGGRVTAKTSVPPRPTGGESRRAEAGLTLYCLDRCVAAGSPNSGAAVNIQPPIGSLCFLLNGGGGMTGGCREKV